MTHRFTDGKMAQLFWTIFMEMNRSMRFLALDVDQLQDSSVVRYLVAGFSIIILLAVTFPVWGGVVLQTETPIVTIESDSMAPVMEQGDRAIVTGTAFSDIQASPDSGDIVVYETEHTDYLIPHRVIDRNETMLETRGDANTDQITFCVTETRKYRATGMGCQDDEELVNVEQTITADQVKGTVLFVIPSVL